MMVNTLLILARLSIILSFVNARPSMQVIKHLPISQNEIDFLAASICSELVISLENKITQSSCENKFKNPVKVLKAPPTPVTVRCRSHTILQLLLKPSDSRQLVVLTPETQGDDSTNYMIIEPKSNISAISIPTPSKNYVLFSTVLHDDGQPDLWYEQVTVPALIVEHRQYNVDMQISNSTSNGKLTGVVTWNRTSDSDMCFEFKNTCSKGGLTFRKIWAGDEPRVILELNVDDVCSISVQGIYGATNHNYNTVQRNKYETESFVKEAETTGIPPDIFLEAVEDGDRWQVRVWWAQPRNVPERYTVTLRTDDIKTLEVAGNASEAIFSDVIGEGVYNVSIFGFKGNSTSHNFARGIFPVVVPSRWAGLAGGAWGGAGLGLLAIALYWLRGRCIRDKPTPKGQESKPLDEALESLETECCEDQWEVKSERLLLHEIIGEGAFGVVRRGSLAPTGKNVAVKMLKEFPSLDEVRAFRLEMELMKSVGAHPHVVSLVGCYSGGRPLIVAEYCARGDLLSFLRCSWDVMVAKRNATYYNNNIETEYRNDLFKWKIQRDHSRLVVNKMYDLQGLSESDLTSLDLLSFCRQIAMGMEFLASNRLVHRDLAARNVLVTADRTLKIADFGLSRDVYEENQYKQKGNGKMPVKWMAPESLTRRIYSSQSDVWSFGVVVWEVVTVGGAPYPEVPAARLPRLLRAGYRMPRPPNCTKQLYELMMCCWRAHPRERPTFAELHQRLDELLNCACADDYLCLQLDDEAPPTPKAQRYFKMIMRGKRAWNRETYERPLKAVQGKHNHYTSPPVTLSKVPV